MLYQFHELQRTLLTPLAAVTDMGAKLFTNPFNPLAYMPVARHCAASYELIHRLGKEYQKSAWDIPRIEIKGKHIAIREHVVLEKPFCRLIHFQRARPSGSTSADPRVLLVAPLSGHHATLLRDTVKTLLAGHEVYVTDWTDARMVPLSKGPFDLNDYVRYVQDLIRHLGPDTHIVSVCQPTVPVLAAISLMSSDNDPCVPRSMIMMRGPIDPRECPTQVNRLATNKPYAWFESQLIHTVPQRYPAAGRRVYPGFLQHAGVHGHEARSPPAIPLRFLCKSIARRP
jgi:poly(3-hydroxybutyrate) depolymerase